MKTDYRFGFFDAQIILVTNYNLLKSRNILSKERLSALFFQTVVKCIREYCNCDKIFLLWDKGPYHKRNLIDYYKGNRFHVSKEMVDNFGKDIQICTKEEIDSYIIELIAENKELPEYELNELINNYKSTHLTQEAFNAEKLRLENELKCDMIKEEVKYFIIDTFGNIGMPSLIFDGYEADDLALTCLKICEENPDGRPSFICSKDSDWRYLLTKNSEILRYHRGTMEKYEEVLSEIPIEVQKKGVSLYLWKSATDALVGSHNYLQNCVKRDKQFDFVDIFDHLNDKDWLEEICDTDVFIPQLKSFEVVNYPDYNEVYSCIKENILGNTGKLLDTKLFSNFSKTYLTSLNGRPISDSYYDKFVSLINPNAYGEIVKSDDIDIDEILSSIDILKSVE